MPSTLNIPSGVAGSDTLPVHVALDAAGNTAVGHTLMTEAAGVATPVGQSNPVPVAGPSGTLTDVSAAVPTTTTTVLAAAARRLLMIVNSGLVEVWVNFGAAATAGQGSLPLLPNGSLQFGIGGGFVPADAINAIAVGSPGALTIKVA